MHIYIYIYYNKYIYIYPSLSLSIAIPKVRIHNYSLPSETARYLAIDLLIHLHAFAHA